ncbi:hypothetical protein LCGC14_0274690 [marine sediment metagenome]|uniref:Uncharacterized protein n=1 Tax=marine sediment metagenome TaxID=412755 RepID=A0A0F9WIS0_9ZZZZ
MTVCSLAAKVSEGEAKMKGKQRVGREIDLRILPRNIMILCGQGRSIQSITVPINATAIARENR